MPEEKAAARGSAATAIALLVTIAAPFAAYAAVRNAAVEAAPRGTDASKTFPPRSTWSEIRAIMRVARQPQQRLPEGSLSAAKRGAIALPLAYEPYFIAARSEEQAGRYERATLLMEEARRRRPNSTSVRFLLLGYYSLANAYQKAIDEADMAMRVNARSMSLVLPAFAKLVAADPKARQAIAVALAKKPIWREAFLDVAANERMDPAAATALVADVRRLSPSATPDAEEAFLVRALVNAGEVQRARKLWEGYRPRGASPAGEIFDPGFRGLKGMPPFVWTLNSGGDGNAEMSRPGSGAPPALEINYFGNAAFGLAEQTVALRPGRYRLASTFAGESSAEDIMLSWALNCLGSNAPVGALPLRPLGRAMTTREAVVTIPASGCQGQKLSLFGQPSDLARSLSAQITNVSLTRLD